MRNAAISACEIMQNTFTFSACENGVAAASNTAISACEKMQYAITFNAALSRLPGVSHGSVDFSAAELERPAIQVPGKNPHAQHATLNMCIAG